jgi:hypothetical protein
MKEVNKLKALLSIEFHMKDLGHSQEDSWDEFTKTGTLGNCGYPRPIM